MTRAPTVVAAQRRCVEITRSRARNFYYGIRLLPPPKRAAMCAVYAFARRVDDIGDGELEPVTKRVALQAARSDLDGLDRATDLVLVALAEAARRYPLPLQAFHDLIDGVEMDVAGVSYATFDDLVRYCRCVAGSIGRLSVAVFGASDAAAATLGDDLGVAMQLTNILRDVCEDNDDGRVYLPAEDLARFDCDLSGSGQFEALMRFEAAWAHAWFDRGLGLLSLLDRRSGACVAAMSGIYRRLLRRIERDPSAVLRGRVSLSAWEKGYVAARSLAGATP